MSMNDINDAFHEQERKRLNLTWDQYWYQLAVDRVGSEDEQIVDVLNQLRCGGYENRVRADTIEGKLRSAKLKKIEVAITISRTNLKMLMLGALKGNIAYGSVASKEGKRTIKLVGKLCDETGIKL